MKRHLHAIFCCCNRCPIEACDFLLLSVWCWRHSTSTKQKCEAL